MKLTINPTLPETGFLRLQHIIGDPKSQPPIPAIIPVSKSTWWAGVRSGRFPKSIKLAPRITVWRVQDIVELIDTSYTSSSKAKPQTQGSRRHNHELD